MDAVADKATDHEVEGWAAREKKRREDWLAGPTEAEKLEWRRRQRQLRESREPYDELDEREFALERRLERDAYLAGAGAFDWLVHLPPRLAAKLIAAGLTRSTTTTPIRPSGAECPRISPHKTNRAETQRA